MPPPPCQRGSSGRGALPGRFHTRLKLRWGAEEIVHLFGRAHVGQLLDGGHQVTPHIVPRSVIGQERRRELRQRRVPSQLLEPRRGDVPRDLLGKNGRLAASVVSGVNAAVRSSRGLMSGRGAGPSFDPRPPAPRDSAGGSIRVASSACQAASCFSAAPLAFAICLSSRSVQQSVCRRGAARGSPPASSAVRRRRQEHAVHVADQVNLTVLNVDGGDPHHGVLARRAWRQEGGAFAMALYPLKGGADRRQEGGRRLLELVQCLVDGQVRGPAPPPCSAIRGRPGAG